MAYEGWLAYGGNEVLNSGRAYGIGVSADCPSGWLRPDFCATLAEATGEAPYSWPNISAAPWFDIDVADVSARFYGVYGIDLLGTQDSTRSVQVTQNSGDGGTIGTLRRGTREVRVRAWLTARGRDAMEYGRTWLDAALSPGACGQHGDECGTSDLAFFADCPPGRGTVTEYGQWTLVRRNLIPNPSVEVDTAGWITAGAVASRSTERAYSGAASLLVTRSTATGEASTRITASGLSVGAQYTLSGWVWVPAASTTNGVRTTVSGIGYGPMTNVREEWVRLVYTFTATATSHQPGFVDGTSGMAVGNVFYLDGVLLEEGATPSPDDYFDGDSLPGAAAAEVQRYLWEGTPGASPSRYEQRSATQLPEDDEGYYARVRHLQRYLHDVTVTSGPLTVQEVISGEFVGQLVEWVFTSQRPWVYGVTEVADLPTTTTTVVQDIPVNLAVYPSAELPGANVTVAYNLTTNPSVETDASGWTATATATSGTAPAAYFTSGRSTDLAAAGVAAFRGRILGNGATEVPASTANLGISYSTPLTSPYTPGMRVSITVWAGVIISAGAGASSVSDVYVDAVWMGASGSLGSVRIGTAGDADQRQGRVYSARSLLPPAGATSVSIQITAAVGWRSSATAANNSDLRFYADALAVTIP